MMLPLRQHVQTSGEGVRRSLLQETVDTLEHMEAFTLKLVLEMVADLAEVAVQLIPSFFFC